MAAVLKTNAEVLAKAASNYEAVADDLKAEIAKVQSAAMGLEQNWKGAAAKAAQSAVKRFSDAAAAQVTELNDISNKIASAGIQYTTTNEQRVAALQHAMDMNGGGH